MCVCYYCYPNCSVYFLQFVEKFNEAKAAAKELVNERQLAAKRMQDQEKTLPPAGSSPSPTSPHIKSPSIISPPASTITTTSKIPSPIQGSPGPEARLSETTETKESLMDGVEIRGEEAERKSSASSSGSSHLVNGGESPRTNSRVTNGHSNEVSE